MKINTFDKTTIQMIRTELQHAIRDIENRHGIKLTAGRAKFGQKSASIAIDMATIDNDGQIIDHDREFLIANLTWVGLKSEHLESVIRIGNDTFKINGYKRARYAKPFSLISMTNGQKYVARESTVRSALGLHPKVGSRV